MDIMGAESHCGGTQRLAVKCYALPMARVFDVEVMLQKAITPQRMELLSQSFSARRVTCVPNSRSTSSGSHDLRFAVYAEFGQFMVGLIVRDCIKGILGIDYATISERN